ncbi:hypothetical protein BCS37_00935 [Selenomonas sp. oral taxon 920]|nr:hypothetical protein BCS37_00935 [Selenomonas sp. oral taxon 920]
MFKEENHREKFYNRAVAMLGVERRQKIMEKLQLEQKVYVSERSKGITDKTDPQIGVDFSSEQGDKPDA